MRQTLLAALVLAAAPLGAQQRDSIPPGPALSLSDALSLASRTNTDLQQVQERRRTARVPHVEPLGQRREARDAAAQHHDLPVEQHVLVRAGEAAAPQRVQ